MNPHDPFAWMSGTGEARGITVNGAAIPAGYAGGFFAYKWGMAPAGLATRRQLAARGLRPGGQDPKALLSWRHGERFAYLYVIADAVPKREPSAAQLGALARAMRARRICPDCRQDAGYCIPRSRGVCNDCHDRRQVRREAA